MNHSSKKFVTIDPPFAFNNGDIFEDPLTIAYETSGTLNDKKDNAILVQRACLLRHIFARLQKTRVLVGGKKLLEKANTLTLKNIL